MPPATPRPSPGRPQTRSATKGASVPGGHSPNGGGGGAGGQMVREPLRSLADMPSLWLSRLLSRKRISDATALALLRACRTLRDLVLESRRLRLRIHVPFRSARAMLSAQKRLGTATRLSSNVLLVFAAHRGDLRDDSDSDEEGDSDLEEDGPPPGAHPRWWLVEPCMSHLLLRGMAEGAQPLTGVRAVRFEGMELSALIPTWLTLPCPNLQQIQARHCVVTPGPHDLLLSSCPSLTSLTWLGCPIWQLPVGAAAQQQPAASLQHLKAAAAERVRQQLTLLPALAQLHVQEWPASAPATVHNAHLSRLHVATRVPALAVQRLPCQFPALRELRLMGTTLEDAGVEALLKLPRLKALAVDGIHVKRSFVQRACTWERLCIYKLNVESFARLPLECIKSAASSCSPRDAVAITATSNVEAVARVEAALRRWGGLGGAAPLHADVHGSTRAVSASLPLLAALPQLQQVDLVGVQEVSPKHLLRLGRVLPPRVDEVSFVDCTFQAASWPALARLPRVPALSLNCFSLPAGQQPTAAQLAALCLAARRRLRVMLVGVVLSAGDRALIRDMARSVDARNVSLALDEDFSGMADATWMWADSDDDDDEEEDGGEDLPHGGEQEQVAGAVDEDDEDDEGDEDEDHAPAGHLQALVDGADSEDEDSEDDEDEDEDDDDDEVEIVELDADSDEDYDSDDDSDDVDEDDE